MTAVSSPDGIIGLDFRQEETTVMKKNRTKHRSRKGEFASGRPGLTSRSPLPPVWPDPRAALFEVVLAEGFVGVMRMLEEDRERLCGPSRLWRSEREAYRHGYTEGRLTLGGRKVAVPKPRVRSLEGREMELPTWKRFAEEDPLHRRVLEQIAVGVSTRNYNRSLEALPEELDSSATSRSSVSRRFVAATRARVEAFLSRPLGELDLPVIMLDGRGMGDHLLVVALGVDTSGKKHVLGVTEGSTESEEVCHGLLGNLIERGLRAERSRLFVIDGGKGLRKAIREVFGSWALVQRCQVHKLRNVLDHLPEGKRTWVRAAMHRAWREPEVAKARGRLKDLARQFEDVHPGAAGSILEGLEETLTVIRLGVSGWLLKTISSTNPIENVQGTLAQVSRNVKRWRGGSMALRWGVTGLIEAEKKFRRVKGHRDMPQLIAAIDALVEGARLDKKNRVA